MNLLTAVLCSCVVGLATSQFFYDMPMPMPVAVPHMVPVYVPMPVMTSRSAGLRPASYETSGDGKGRTYYKTFNDKLPGGVGRGHVYEYHRPGHHEYSNSYATSQSWGSPLSNSFASSDSISNGYSKSYSNSWSSESKSHSDTDMVHSPRVTKIITSYNIYSCKMMLSPLSRVSRSLAGDECNAGFTRKELMPRNNRNTTDATDVRTS
ncbi:hypothetical protein Aduo_015725 [Ancylostoma duodenale]